MDCCAAVPQIHYILVQNRQGKTRLAKWYSSFNDSEKIRLLSDVYRTMSARQSKFANFVEVRSECIQPNSNTLFFGSTLNAFLQPCLMNTGGLVW